jgi:hypothetical protein
MKMSLICLLFWHDWFPETWALKKNQEEIPYESDITKDHFRRRYSNLRKCQRCGLTQRRHDEDGEWFEVDGILG